MRDLLVEAGLGFPGSSQESPRGPGKGWSFKGDTGPSGYIDVGHIILNEAARDLVNTSSLAYSPAYNWGSLHKASLGDYQWGHKPGSKRLLSH